LSCPPAYHHLPSFFLFYAYAAHRDLHSFPTRRSSDLPPPGGNLIGGSNEEAEHVVQCARWRSPFGAGCVRAGWGSHFRRRRQGRSEEHTSELQSLTNLVCRLLLEKKKTTTHTRRHNYY